MKTSKMHPCPGCNGTGQTSYFGGVSRFLLSYEDCQECNGIGLLAQEPDNIFPFEQISAQSGLSPLETKKFIRELAHALSMVLIQGEPVHIRGFGSFSLSSTSTGKKHISFTPGLNLQKILNDSEQ